MADTVETRAAQFARYLESSASRLRYTQAQRNLLELHDLGGVARALDAAGGSGVNSEFLLRRGHEVTLLDSDPEMLAQARERLGRAGLLGRCTLALGSLEEIGSQLHGERFDLVLCHHALEYTRESAGTLKAFAELTRPGGTLSLVTLNPVSEVIRAVVFRQDPVLGRSKLTDLRFDARWFGEARLHPMDRIVGWAEEAGWSLRDFRGIRILADYLHGSPTPSGEADLLRLETELARLEPYRRFGRYLQLCFAR